jgi:hypothetical protein
MNDFTLGVWQGTRPPPNQGIERTARALDRPESWTAVHTHHVRRNGVTVLIARNCKAAFIWGFSCFFLAGVGAMTLVLLRDGVPPGYPPALSIAIAAVFWLGALGLAGFASSQSCTRVSLGPGSSVTFVRRYPFKVSAHTVTVAELPTASVVQSVDSDGSRYFYARTVLPDGTEFDLFEGHDRPGCERVVERFEALRNG